MNSLNAIIEAIERVAPDADAHAVPDDADFRDELELDSMDFLGVLNAVREATGVEVPEADYQCIRTIRDFADYVAQRAT